MESLLYILIVCPILLTGDLGMMNGGGYIFVSISRYTRVAFFSVIILKYVDLGETDVDR
jgi:hypothetical protein